jgi:Insulinase (Peptidase family M16)
MFLTVFSTYFSKQKIENRPSQSVRNQHSRKTLNLWLLSLIGTLTVLVGMNRFASHRNYLAYSVVTAFHVSSAESRLNPLRSSSSGKQCMQRLFGKGKSPHQSFMPGKHGLMSTSLHRRTLLSSSQTAVATKTEILDLQKNYDTTHPAYDVLEKDIVTEYGAYCTLYRHKKSGAELLSVSVDDDNKVFGITLRTPPDDSTGVPHILEHSVLCGSRKYTTKDPFVQLLKGSLQTFLNAFTYPDRTCYVVASQNVKDFYNLINVYADAVYHPRAVKDPMVLAQEGWHFELNDDNQLVYNGVV